MNSIGGEEMYIKKYYLACRELPNSHTNDSVASFTRPVSIEQDLDSASQTHGSSPKKINDLSDPEHGSVHNNSSCQFSSRILLLPNKIPPI